MMKLFTLRGSILFFPVLTALSLIFVGLFTLPPLRVGDGSEYYALFIAWSETHRPWMTPGAFSLYDILTSSGEIRGLVSVDWLENAFPSLRVNDTADFNHFWFYSLLAFLVSKIFDFVGLALSAHQSFLALHYLLLVSTFLIGFHFFRWRGLVALTIMTFSSPILWYFDKVHTEIFTYCFALTSVLCILKNKLMLSAFLLAIASTQNPSFAIIAFVPFFYRTIILRNKSFTYIELAIALATALTVLSHPAYYFFRYGVPTPQLLAGGSSLGADFSTAYIWLLDPDIGLLPNWPLGIVVLSYSIYVAFHNRGLEVVSNRTLFYAFILVFFLVNFYAHSSTTNLNSGGTPGIARYALWYLPPFFPVVYYLTCTLKRNYREYIVGGFFIFIGVTVNLYQSDPRKGESYLTPSLLSSAIQSRASFLYNPPPEIFAERYSGLGETSFSTTLGILGPDCSKILLFPGVNREAVTAPSPCSVDMFRLRTTARSIVSVSDSEDPFYARLERRELGIKIEPGSYLVGKGKHGNHILRSGWSSLEPWGVWSDDGAASLALPCNSDQFYYQQKSTTISLNLRPSPVAPQRLVITSEGITKYKGVLDEQTEIEFDVDVGKCAKDTLDLEIEIMDPKSPFDHGLSEDTRLLGVGLSSYSVQ